MKVAFASANDYRTLMELWSHLTTVKLFIPSASRTTGSRSTNSLFSINLACCGWMITYTALASHSKAKHLTLNEQIWPGPTSMGMEARRGFSAKVTATTTDTSAANNDFRMIHLVSVDAPDEKVFKAVGHGFLQSYVLQRCEQNTER